MVSREKVQHTVLMMYHNIQDSDEDKNIEQLIKEHKKATLTLPFIQE